MPVGAEDECLGQRVSRELIERGSEAEHLFLVDPSNGISALDLRGAEGKRPRLVEDHRPRLAELLDRGAALDDHTDAGGARDTREDGHRRCEDQRARASRPPGRRARERGLRSAPRRGRRRPASPAGRRRHSGRPCGRRAPCGSRPPARGERPPRTRSLLPAESPAARMPRRRSPFRCESGAPFRRVTGSGFARERRLVETASALVTSPSIGTTSPWRTSTWSPMDKFASTGTSSTLSPIRR